MGPPPEFCNRGVKGKMRVLIGPKVQGILQTYKNQDISTLLSGCLIVDHAIEFDKPRVRMHYSTLQPSNG